MLTVDRLREVLLYDAKTGVFTWRRTLHGRFPAGSRAGSVTTKKNRSNYRLREIGIDRRVYSEHRLAWLYVHGEWPPSVIDHINGDATDNRLVNIRAVSQAVNCQNRTRASCASGYLGASWDKQRGKWRATIGVGGKNVYLGHFTAPEQAHQAYIEARKTYRG